MSLCNFLIAIDHKIKMSFSFSVAPTLIEFVEDGIPSRTVDDNLTIPLRMFGSPTPTLTLYKLATSSKRAIEGYEVVTDPRIIVSTTGITFNFLQFTDEGSYLLIAETVQGNSNITFAVNVTGVLTFSVYFLYLVLEVWFLCGCFRL